jgi:hypothetical protein
LTLFLAGIVYGLVNWQISPTTQWEKDKKWYAKKRPTELAAVLRNLDRYVKLLNISANSRVSLAGFMHTEQAGVIAIDESGGGKSLAPTRLYVYADDNAKVVYLIRIGNKDEQSDDVQFSKEFVEYLKSQQQTQ